MTFKYSLGGDEEWVWRILLRQCQLHAVMLVTKEEGERDRVVLHV